MRILCDDVTIVTVFPVTSHMRGNLRKVIEIVKKTVTEITVTILIFKNSLVLSAIVIRCDDCDAVFINCLKNWGVVLLVCKKYSLAAFIGFFAGNPSHSVTALF
jgi:hypothetical protein